MNSVSSASKLYAQNTYLHFRRDKKAVGMQLAFSFNPSQGYDQLPITESADFINIKVFQTTSIHRSKLWWFELFPTCCLPNFGNGTICLLGIKLKVLNNLRVRKVLNAGGYIYKCTKLEVIWTYSGNWLSDIIDIKYITNRRGVMCWLSATFLPKVLLQFPKSTKGWNILYATLSQ